eukprot:479749-Alexandrium_andersonii.AAC.1
MKKPIGWRPWQCTGQRHFGTLGVPCQLSCTAPNSVARGAVRSCAPCASVHGVVVAWRRVLCPWCCP